MCGCGKGERLAVYVEAFGRWVHSKWCAECDAKQKVIAEKAEAVAKVADIERKIERCIPEIYLGARLADIQPDVLAMLKTKQPEQGIYLWGDVGRGKTHTASAIAINAIQQGKSVKRAAFKDITDKIQETFTNYGSAEMIYKRYIQANLLVIEDLGTGKTGGIESDFNQETLLKLIDRRSEAKKPTIITSNLSPEILGESFGTRILSRLSTFLIIKLTGTDRRSSGN